MPYKNLDKYSVGIELTNWACLVEKDGKYYNYVNGIVDPSEVTRWIACNDSKNKR